MPAELHPNLVEHFRSQFETYSDSRTYTFLRESGRHLVPEVTSVGQLDRSAREIAAWLSTRPEATRPVLLLYEPGVLFWQAFFGCLYAGVTAIPAPLPHDERSMTRVMGILRDADSGLALTTVGLRDLIVAGIDAVGASIACVATDESRLADADSWVMPDITADSVAFLQYTSGSTGSPKGVAVTHGNVVDNVTALVRFFDLGDATVLVGWIPHFHDMGLISQVVTLYSGGNVVTMSPLSFLKQPVRLVRALSDFRATVTAAPNFAYDLIARRVSPDQLTGLDLSSVEVAFNGAEPIRSRSIEAINRVLGPAGFRSTAMRPCYGMAEVTLFATGAPSSAPLYCLDADADALERNVFAPPRRRSVTLVSSGVPGPHIDVRIVDHETLEIVPDGQVGEIWLRGASVAAGYHNRPAESDRAFRAESADGDRPYLRTGDLGLLRDGYLFVTGRLKDLLIVNGRNIYPQDIEELVAEVHPATRDARGVAVAVDAQDGERLVVIQSVRTDHLGDLSPAQLASAIKTAVARGFELPAPSVVLVDRAGIHVTTSGKVQRASMRAAFLREHLTDVLHQSIDIAVTAARQTEAQK